MTLPERVQTSCAKIQFDPPERIEHRDEFGYTMAFPPPFLVRNDPG